MDAIAEAVAWATCTSDPHQVHAGLPAGLILGHGVVARLVKVGSAIQNQGRRHVCVGAVTTTGPGRTARTNPSGRQRRGQGMNWCVTENSTFAERFRIRQVDCQRDLHSRV